MTPQLRISDGNGGYVPQNRVVIDGIEYVVKAPDGNGNYVTYNSYFPPNQSEAGYDFERGSGTTVIDRSGNGHDGSFQGGPIWTTNTPSNDGYALSFDGVDDYVLLDSVFESGHDIYEYRFQFYPRAGDTWFIDQDDFFLIGYRMNGGNGVCVGFYGDHNEHSKNLALNEWHDVYVRFEPLDHAYIVADGDAETFSDDSGSVGGLSNDTYLGVNPYGFTNYSKWYDGILDNVVFAQGDSPVLEP